MSSSTQVLDDFRRRYESRPPEPDRIRDASETVRIDARDGLRFLEPAPATGVTYGTPPKSSSEKTNLYLWVIDERGVPYLLEVSIARIGAAPKHTNLTGGDKAYLGGEAWFESDTALCISGGSGRYPPQNPAQIDEAVKVFESFGYRVASLGWDKEDGAARRWLETF